MRLRALHRLAALGTLVTGLACAGTGPRPLALGQEPCTHCHMTVLQPEFAAEAVLSTGRTFVFDDVGCLLAWLGEQSERPAALWVWSTVPGEGWLPAEQALYVHAGSLHTPMGSQLAAVRAGTGADSLAGALGGELRTWPDLLHEQAGAGAS